MSNPFPVPGDLHEGALNGHAELLLGGNVSSGRQIAGARNGYLPLRDPRIYSAPTLGFLWEREAGDLCLQG